MKGSMRRREYYGMKREEGEEGREAGGRGVGSGLPEDIEVRGRKKRRGRKRSRTGLTRKRRKRRVGT